MSGPAPESPAEKEVQEVRYFFIRRPVLASVLSITITLLGLLAIFRLPVARYPQITPPSIRVTAVYPGASAEDVAQSVAAPIEEQLNGLKGLLYYSSSNSSDGTMTLTVTFDISRDQDLAAVDVQNAIKLAEPELPQSVIANGISIIKANTDILALVALTSTDPRYDASYLTNYMNLYVVDELERIPGVGSATAFAGLNYSMRLDLNPEKMAQLGITVSDVADAVREQNATNPAGTIGAEPAPAGTELTIPVTAQGRLQTVKQFDDIIIRAEPDGAVVRLKDIGKAVLGAQSYSLEGRLDGKPTAILLLYSRPGANSLAVKNAIVKRMNQLARSFPPGVRYSIPFDTTPFITQSIHEVVVTLVEALLLVTLVVFLFLEGWRATLIPMLAVPVSVIGTFGGLLALHMSINVLTLFGLVLAIGIVVDDAIVVIENVERIMAADKVSARVAADRAIRQVAAALVAIVLSLCAVFIPVAFIGGVTGELFRQFAVTIVISVVISGIVALTLTPALCSLLLKESTEANVRGFFGWFNRTFQRGRRGYVRAVGHVLDRPTPWLGVFLVIIGLTAVLWTHIPTSFIPTEDKGYIAISVQLPDAASLQRTVHTVSEIEGILRRQPAVNHFVALAGFSILGFASQTNAATIFVQFKPWGQRGPGDETASAIAQRINYQLFALKGATAFAFNLPEVPGLGTTAGVEMNLQDLNGQSIQSFAGRVQEFQQDVNRLAAAGQINTSFRATVPQLYVNVNRTAAEARGVNLSNLFGTLQTFLSGLYINDFNLYGKTFRVQAEADSEFRQTPSDLSHFYVRGNGGKMVPVSSLATTEYRAGPTVVPRFNGFPSALFTGAPKPGYSSGELLNEVDSLVQARFVSQGVGIAYSGESYQERASRGDAVLVFAIGLVIVFLVLAAQYESWSVPFAVLLGLPFGVLGALIGIWLRGQPNDIYFQVGVIAVVGLAAKNAILIVEFATELRAKGLSIRDAALEAARERLRPILMTSFAFILGVLPLAVATGAGAASRHSIGTGVFAGMLFATSIGIFFIPLFFEVIRRIAERGRGEEPATWLEEQEGEGA